jgi:hypothetical protein
MGLLFYTSQIYRWMEKILLLNSTSKLHRKKPLKQTCKENSGGGQNLWIRCPGNWSDTLAQNSVLQETESEIHKSWYR